jgi:3-oxoacyl-[acyl-carrier protein] reductase
LITGAAAGIGREIALCFAAEGAEIVAVDRDANGSAMTGKMIQSAGGRCSTFQADVSCEKDVVEVFQAAGPVNILVNNAASAEGDGRFIELEAEAWDHVLGICLRSVFLCSREALKTMVPQRSGRIVNLSSVNAMAGINLTAYTAAKGGILSLTRLIAAQYGQYGIRANAICPGTIMSESSRAYYDEHPALEADLRALYPAGEFGTVQDVAACALFLASDSGNFINGVALPVDGGLLATRPIPALMSREKESQ